MPIQRFPHYMLFLNRYLKYTSKEHPDFEKTAKVYDLVKRVSNLMDQKLIESTKARNFTEFLRKIDGIHDLATQDRFLIREGVTFFYLFIFIYLFIYLFFSCRFILC